MAARCRFSLDEIRYRYPLETVLPGMTAQQTLAWLTWEGARARHPAGVPDWLQAQIGKELDLIADCGYEMYFLTVHDIVRYARSQGMRRIARVASTPLRFGICMSIRISA